VGEALWHVDLLVGAFFQVVPIPPPEGRGLAAQVDGHVEDLARHRGHELPLPARGLVVQAAQDTPPREGEVVLDVERRQPRGGIALPVHDLQEVAALVREDAGADELESGQG
jgi:hypothetical protein